jgi:hypothetical protein
MLSALSEGWQHRLFQSPSEVVPELIAELQRREADQSNFLRRPRHVDEIRENNAFAHLMRAWTNADSVFDCEQLRAVAHRMLRGRFVLLEPQRDGRTLIIEDWGPRLWQLRSALAGYVAWIALRRPAGLSLCECGHGRLL